MNDNLAFGIDISQFNNLPGKLMDFEQVALHKDPVVSFVVCRTGISWGYQDKWFKHNWDGIKTVGDYRELPCGRGAYHVLYPGEDATRQSDNMFRIIGDADWNHDRIVIDLELHHNQSKRRITDVTKQFAGNCKRVTGRYPILYARSLWLNAHTYPVELGYLDMWLAQYRYSLPYPLYTPEYQSPPDPLPNGIDTWLIHQTAERGKPIGSPASRYMDYNRWNGGVEDVVKYFGYDNIPDEPQNPVELPSDALERLWQAHPELH
jgi:GH25 family lysozyme M1 (1,4-beta-N-acetylmuramidase)